MEATEVVWVPEQCFSELVFNTDAFKFLSHISAVFIRINWAVEQYGLSDFTFDVPSGMLKANG